VKSPSLFKAEFQRGFLRVIFIKMTSKSSSLVIITGPIGAGKSSVMRELVACSTGNIASIEGDTFWKFMKQGSIPRHEAFKTVMRAMISAAVAFAVCGNDVFLDFTIPPWYFDAVRKIVGDRGVRIDLVVLRPSESLCANRSVSRREGAIDYATESHCHELYEEFSTVAAKRVVSDDVSDAKTIAEVIRKGLDEGRFRLPAPFEDEVAS
jgi:chloramphenicol 3-O-phosphotransferase